MIVTAKTWLLLTPICQHGSFVGNSVLLDVITAPLPAGIDE
jgi:hypothetical protein